MAQYWFDVADESVATGLPSFAAAHPASGSIDSSLYSGTGPNGTQTLWRVGPSTDETAIGAIFDDVPSGSTTTIAALTRNPSATATGTFNFNVTRQAFCINATSFQGYQGGFREADSVHRIRRFDAAAAASNIASVASGTGWAGEWIWQELKRNGDDVELRVWLHGNERPSTATLVVTDTTYTSGLVGVMGYNDTEVDFAAFGVGTDGDAAPLENPAVTRKITLTDLKAPNDANSTVANATGVQVKLWISSDSNDPIDVGAPDVLVTDATITSGTMEVTFDTTADVGNPVLGVAKWTVSTDDYFFPIDTTVQESV